MQNKRHLARVRVCLLCPHSLTHARLQSLVHSADVRNSAYSPAFKFVAVADGAGAVSLIDLAKPAVLWLQVSGFLGAAMCVGEGGRHGCICKHAGCLLTNTGDSVVYQIADKHGANTRRRRCGRRLCPSRSRAARCRRAARARTRCPTPGWRRARPCAVSLWRALTHRLASWTLPRAFSWQGELAAGACCRRAGHNNTCINIVLAAMRPNKAHNTCLQGRPAAPEAPVAGTAGGASRRERRAAVDGSRRGRPGGSVQVGSRLLFPCGDYVASCC